jgi:hypothetical protein
MDNIIDLLIMSRLLSNAIDMAQDESDQDDIEPYIFAPVEMPDDDDEGKKNDNGPNYDP